jgi:polysaccharide export outer membrane protein
MRTRILVTALLLIVPTVASAQTQTRQRRSANPEATPAARERLVNARALNHVDIRKPVADPSPGPNVAQTSGQTVAPGAWGNSTVNLRPPDTTTLGNTQVVAATSSNSNPRPATFIKPTSLPITQPVNASPTVNAVRAPAASVYTVGVGDVLDVRLLNLTTRESTLYTVMKDGTLEYPLVGSPVRVVGLTTDEIAKLLTGQIKVLNSPRLAVSVRDYTSHAVIVTGAVGNPGRKILRREAMPLFAVLSEALVRPEATTAVVIHDGKEGVPINLRDEKAIASLVVTGDTIKISDHGAVSGKFIYVGGNVASPGEKTFREGMTLTQAVLAAGGTSPSAKMTVKISRRNQSGFLVTSEYQLNSIEEGKAQDPQLEAGDRIEVTGKI